MEGGQLTARGSLGVEGQELRAGESQGAESLVQGKETARCDWIELDKCEGADRERGEEVVKE